MLARTAHRACRHPPPAAPHCRRQYHRILSRALEGDFAQSRTAAAANRTERRGASCKRRTRTSLRSSRPNDILTTTEHIPIPPSPTSVNGNPHSLPVQLALILSIVLQENKDFKHELHVSKHRADRLDYPLNGIFANQQEPPRYPPWNFPSQNSHSRPSSTSRQSSTQSAQPPSTAPLLAQPPHPLPPITPLYNTSTRTSRATPRPRPCPRPPVTRSSSTPARVRSKVYKTLAGGVRVPFVRWFDTECDYNAMVIDPLGPSLEDLFNFCNQKFSLEMVLLLADQLVWSCSLVISNKLSSCFRFRGSSTSTRATSFTATSSPTTF